MEFNADGSLKLPGKIGDKAKRDENRLQTQRCIKVRREVLSFTAPKKCMLKITLSKAIQDPRFVKTIFDQFRMRASVPCKMTELEDGNYEVEVGTDFRRCTDCSSLVYRYREFLDGNLIEDKGNCTFEPRIYDEY